MAEIANHPEVSDCGDRRLELSRNLNQNEVGWRTTGQFKIGHQVTIGAKSGVMRDIPSKATVLGVPAVPDRQTKRQWLGTQQLPEMIHRLRKMEKQLEELKAKSR